MFFIVVYPGDSDFADTVQCTAQHLVPHLHVPDYSLDTE